MKALFLIIAMCAGASAQQATGTLKGQVVDELGGALGSSAYDRRIDAQIRFSF